MKAKEIIPIMGTLQYASDISGLSYSAIRKLCLTGQITHIRIGRKYFINMDRFRDFLNEANGERL